MRRDIIDRAFAVMAFALGFAWLLVFGAAISGSFEAAWFPRTLFYRGFFAAHVIASLAAAVAALFGIVVLIRRPQVRRPRSYVTVTGAIVVCVVLSCITAALHVP